MKSWLEGLLLLAVIPLAWKLIPALWNKVKGPVNAAIEALLLKTKSLWKGHAKDLEAGVDEIGNEIKQDIEDADKEP